MFLENGHGNADDAIRKIRAIQQATEPVEPLDLPDEVMDVSVLEEDQVRTRMMRIGDVALISKLTSAPTQAADLLAHFMASSCLKKPHPVFEGVFDELLEGTPHILSPWSPKTVQELVAVTFKSEELQKEQRAKIYSTKKTLRSYGFKVYELPWGLVVDKHPIGDALSQEFQSQVDAIQAKFKKMC